jgi:hypothetical protein
VDTSQGHAGGGTGVEELVDERGGRELVGRVCAELGVLQENNVPLHEPLEERVVVFLVLLAVRDVHLFGIVDYERDTVS